MKPVRVVGGVVLVAALIGFSGCDSGTIGGCSLNCDQPPGPCYQRPGTCSSGQCSYLPDNGKVCDDGDACTLNDVCNVGSCAGTPMNCSSPPPPECFDANTRRAYSGGSCLAGQCQYSHQDTLCPAGCLNGACVGDPCAGVTCDQPPGFCYLGTGSCSNGQCSYPPDNGKGCDDGDACTVNDTCGGGSCAGTPMDCSSPSPPKCFDANTRRVYGSGSCQAGQCQYSFHDTVCPLGCLGGQCQKAFPTYQDQSSALPANQRSTTDVQIVDVNSDGLLDIVWASQPDAQGNDGGVDISLNQGSGVFVAGDTSGFPTLGSWSFVLAVDVDGDGDLDLVLSRPATTKPELVLLVNDGTGKFTEDDTALPSITGQQYGYVFGRVAAGDFDHDGHVDLIVPVSFNTTFDHDMPNLLLMNQGDGTFAIDTSGRLPSIPEFTDYTISVAVGDVNGDGAPDIYLGEAENQQRLLINDGTGHFLDQSTDDGNGVPRLPANPIRGYHCLMVDLNHDGALDIVVVNDASTTSGQPVVSPNDVFLNDGTGHFTIAVLPSTDSPHDSRGLAVADIDLDGNPDILIGNATETISHGGTALEILLGKGDGSFVPKTGLPTFGAGIFGVAAGDLNADGWADIAAAVAEEDPVSHSLANILLLSQ